MFSKACCPSCRLPQEGAVALAAAKAKAKVRGKSRLDDIMQQAIKVKREYLAVMGATATVVEQIESNPGWGWACNGANLGKLKGLRQQILSHRRPQHRPSLKQDLFTHSYTDVCVSWAVCKPTQVSSTSTDFIRTFLITESKDLRGTFGSEQLHVQFTNFLEVEPLVTELGKYRKRVPAMHAATSRFQVHLLEAAAEVE